MLTSDLPEFEAIIESCEKVFGKELDDDTVRVYWDALKDLSLATFRRLAEHHIRNGKFFPKPFELRPKEERGVVRDAAGDASFREAEARCVANLEDLRRRDPAQWSARVSLAKLDRLIATTHESHPGYQHILNEWRAARGIHVGQKELEAARIP
jgi:hypothetical protein